MSKKIIVLVAIVVVTGLLIGALNFVQKLEGPQQSQSVASVSESIYVLGGPDSTNRTVNVHISGKNGSFTVVDTKPNEAKSTMNYAIEGYEGLAINPYDVTAIADRAANLVVQSVIAESGANLAEFGLDKPSTTVDITYHDNTKAKLFMGNSAPGDSGVYVMKDGDPAVYLLYMTSAEYFLANPIELVDLAITAGNPHESFINSAVLGGAVRENEIRIRQADQSENSGQMAFATHDIVAPIQARLHIIGGLEPVASVFGLYASEVAAKIDSNDELSKYGLAEPYSTIEIKSETDGEFKLLASKPGDDGNCYVVREGVPAVYIVPSASLLWLELTPFQAMEKMLVIPFIDSVSGVTVELPGQTFKFTLEAQEDLLTVALDGQPYEDVKNFRQFYQTLLSASYESYTEEKPDTNAKVLLRFSYSYRDGSEPTVITFYEGASRKVFIQLDDESPMYALSSYVDRVISDTAKVVAGEAIKSYY